MRLNTLSKIKNLDKLIDKASKDHKLVKVFLNDENYENVHKYLKSQNYLPKSDLLKILDIRNFNNYPFGYAMINSDNRIVGFMGTFFSSVTNFLLIKALSLFAIIVSRLLFCLISWALSSNFSKVP